MAASNRPAPYGRHAHNVRILRRRRHSCEDVPLKIEAAYDQTVMHAQWRQLYGSTTIGTKVHSSARRHLAHSARNFRALMALQVEWKRHISKGSRNHRHKADQAHFKRLVRKGGTGGGATNARKTTPTPDRLLCVPESLYQL